MFFSQIGTKESSLYLDLCEMKMMPTWIHPECLRTVPRLRVICCLEPAEHTHSSTSLSRTSFSGPVETNMTGIVVKWWNSWTPSASPCSSLFQHCFHLKTPRNKAVCQQLLTPVSLIINSWTLHKRIETDLRPGAGSHGLIHGRERRCLQRCFCPGDKDSEVRGHRASCWKRRF